MRSSFPKRPAGPSTWIEARFLPTDAFIIYKCDNHVYIYTHPDSDWNKTPKFIHHIAALSRGMIDGQVVTSPEMNEPVPDRLVKNLSRRIQKSDDPREEPVFLAAYGILYDRLPSDARGELQGVIRAILAA